MFYKPCVTYFDCSNNNSTQAFFCIVNLVLYVFQYHINTFFSSLPLSFFWGGGGVGGGGGGEVNEKTFC